MISEIIKTDFFFVGKKGEKKMYLLNKLNETFDKLHTKIDRNDARRRQRKFMRKCCFEIYLFDDDFDYKVIHKTELPNELQSHSVKKGTLHIKLKTHTLVIIEDSNSEELQYRGYYRGEEKDMINIVNRLYD
jgi:hypothetical protein